MTRKGLLFGITVLLMAGVAGFLGWLKGHQRLGRPGVRLELPQKVLGYDSVPLEVTDIEIKMLPSDTTFARRRYFRAVDGGTNYLQLSIVLMGSDRTSIHNPQFCLTGQGWQLVGSERSSVPIERPRPYELPVRRITGRGTLRYPGPDGSPLEMPCSAQYVYWFVADGQITADAGERMWWMARDLMTTGVLSRWAYVSVLGVCHVGREDALFEEIKRFVAAAAPEFQTTGPTAGEPARHAAATP